MTGAVRVLILAAGASRRLGRDKALLRLASGETLLERAIEAARGAGLRAAVTVASAESAAAQEAQRLDVPVIVVPEASEGMAASLRAGVAALAVDPEVAGILVLLVDQWRVGSNDLAQLIDAWEAAGRQVAAARYGGMNGVPALFGRPWFDMLENLSGDRGARDFLRSGDAAITAIDMPTAAVDLDTPEAASSMMD